VYKIRLEGIGGYGANLIGKLLGQIAFEYLNKYARAFSSYGSEKRGSPVKGYIYISDAPIIINTPITTPDILCIFTPSLAGKENLICGVEKDTNVIINTDKSPEEIVNIFKLPKCKLWTIDATKTAVQCHSRVNMVLLGAIAKASGFISLENCIDIVKKTLVPNGNVEALKMGYDNVKFTLPESEYFPVRFRELENNTSFGGINHSNGSTITNRLEGCREGTMPFYIREKCIDCGLCESTCPDMVFQFKDGKNLGMDLYHCKGCMRCVEICPTEALVEVEEGKYTKNIGNIYLINKNFSFDNTGYSSFVEGDSYDAEGSTDKSI
jgi:2-oxoacid:acceptor oxidoreductase, gamma subunit, pyruvate/2-ketoisovalerate family